MAKASTKAAQAELEARKQAAYQRRRVEGHRIDGLMQAGKHTAEQIAAAVGCKVNRVMAHYRWANSTKQPRYEINADKQFVLIGKPVQRRVEIVDAEPVKKPRRKRKEQPAATA